VRAVLITGGRRATVRTGGLGLESDPGRAKESESIGLTIVSEGVISSLITGLKTETHNL